MVNLMIRLLPYLIFIIIAFNATQAVSSGFKEEDFQTKIEVPVAASLPIETPRQDYCVKEPQAGLLNLNCEGLTFKLHVPKICLLKSCGLIVDVHGWNMDARMQDRNTNLSNLANAKGYIVLNPQAKKTTLGRSWSADDDKKVLAVINSVEKVFQVMEERIHFTGFSQGAYMTWRFVCKYSDKFGSVAPIASGAGTYVANTMPLQIKVVDDCFGSNELDVLYAHGRKDGLVHFSGAIATVKKLGSEWQLKNGKIIFQDQSHKRISFINANGTKLEFISYDWTTKFGTLLGHCFPGSETALGCGKENSFHWGEEVLKFFIANPKQI